MEYDDPSPKKGTVKNKQQDPYKQELSNQKEMNFDKKKAIKGQRSVNPDEEYGNDNDDELRQSKDFNQVQSKYQTNQTNRSLLARSMNKSTRSMVSQETTNPDKLQFIKKCRKLRGYALLESLFNPLYKTCRQALKGFEYNLS